MLRCISVFFVVFICWACEVDYSFGEKDFKPRVVVNALISPQEPFAVRLHWSRSYSAQSGFTPVGEAEIRLYEDNTEVVRCPADPEGTTQTTFRAAAGRSYRLRSPVMASCLPERRFPKRPQPAYRSRTKRDGIGIST